MNNKKDFIQIGLKIRSFRVNKKFTQERLAELVGCSKTHIGHIEKGYIVSLELLIKIVNALETTLDDVCCNSLLFADKVFRTQLNGIFENCNAEEMKALSNICETALKELRMIKQNRKG